ncbi:uncharacterized protein LOC107747899 [Sinocyclocheilus rhinocerous]|uniref:uncharacterized protein LOC107747899 n=1 Tax=Sinocyclocheilus rhinocerous TaxID=307959 RepID=UPI0007B81011|nr:PREDICTED: uncharacterized protein LOC107747899 [Sinocyclocheilus rhinocerous]
MHLTYLLTARLRPLSPAADSAKPRPPRHIPPPPDSGRGALRPAAPPIPGEEVRHGHLRPRPVDHLELKWLESQIPTSDPRIGILHAVEPLQGRVVRTESELPAQEIITEGENRPPDRQALLFNGAVHRLSLRELTTDVQHRPFLTLYLLGQDRSKPPVRCVRLQQEGERKIRRVQKWSATQSSRNRCRLTNLGTHLPVAQVEAQIPHLDPPNRTLLRVGRQSGPSQRSQYGPHMLHMPLPVVAIDNNIIQISSSICRMWPKNLIHEALKRGRRPEQPERKRNELVQSERRGEGCFFFG